MRNIFPSEKLFSFATVRNALFASALSSLCLTSALAEDWKDNFIDPEDNKFDVTKFLGRGGFVPVPIIITEPAVDKGFGILGQFVHGHPADKDVSRTMVGAFYTGNSSYGLGALRMGSLNEGRIKYTVGGGGANLNLPIYPFGTSQAIDYNDKSYGLLATARAQIGETPWYFGPSAKYRVSKIKLNADGRLGEIVNRFQTNNRYVSAGIQATYDTRDNVLTPLEGVNAALSYDVYNEAIGSDANFEIGSIALHSFYKFADSSWSVAGMTRYDWSGGDTPFFMAPQISLRGISQGRYAGDYASSTEIQLRKDFDNRWAGIAFAGYGKSFASDSGLFESSNGISTYGLGFRYKIARKLGIDVGIDVAKGPEETIWMIQFGHAWARTMN